MTGLFGDWTPDSTPELKSTLLMCRQVWIHTFGRLRDAAHTIGAKLHQIRHQGRGSAW